MKYETYYLRSPNEESFIKDLKSALSDAGIDPYGKNLIAENENGEDEAGLFISLIKPGDWYIVKPTIKEGENGDDVVSDSGKTGDYLLVNARTKDPELQAFIESFGASDASKQPSEIPGEEKIGQGTHRVDGSTIDSPVRVFATV